MKTTDVDRLTDWIVRRGLEGAEETDLLREFCEKCNAAGLAISRALAFIDTLHPVHEGTIFRWRDDDVEEKAIIEYGRSNQGAAAEAWQRSPFFHLLHSGGPGPRPRIRFRQPAAL